MATACLLQQRLYNASYMMLCFIINHTTRCKIVKMSSVLFTVLSAGLLPIMQCFHFAALLLFAITKRLEYFFQHGYL